VITQYSSIIEEFKKFYLDKEVAHQLEFQFEASNCDVWANFASGKYLLESISILQALMLAFVEANPDTSFKDIKNRFSKLARYITPHLIPLCKKGPKQILKKSPDTETFKDSDTFAINLDFDSKKKKVTFNQLSKREVKEDIEETREKVLQERLYAIESLIVRTMKSNKTMSHQKLVHTVLIGLKLPLTGKDITKCIDSLITRDYMKRDEDDIQKYHYVA